MKKMIGLVIMISLSITVFSREQKSLLSLGVASDFYKESASGIDKTASAMGFGIAATTVYENGFTLMVPASFTFFDSMDLDESGLSINNQDISGSLFHSSLMFAYSPINDRYNLLSLGVGPSFSIINVEADDESEQSYGFYYGYSALISYKRFISRSMAIDISLLYGKDVRGSTTVETTLTKTTESGKADLTHLVPSICLSFALN